MKTGWKTTEFWITIFTVINGIVGQYAELIPQPYGLVVSAVVGAAYTISRGIAKKGNGLPGE